MKSLRKIISIDEEKCTGCGLCVPSCAEGAIEIVDGKARLVSDRYCDGLGACLGECPAGALKVIEAEADAFDEEAVREHLTVRDRKPEPPEQPTMACGCPSAMIRTFRPAPQRSVRGPGRERTGAAQESALTHWPVQIRLVPPTAPFLKGAELLVAADCTPLAYPDFHRDLLKGKVVLLGCPKFDDTEAYVQKFRGIFEKSDIRRITAVVMEVPCCRGLPVILQKAMALAGKHIPTGHGRDIDRREEDELKLKAGPRGPAPNQPLARYLFILQPEPEPASCLLPVLPMSFPYQEPTGNSARVRRSRPQP